MKKTNSRVNPILFQADMEDLLRQIIPELNWNFEFPTDAYVFMSSSEIEDQIDCEYENYENPGVSFKWVLATIPRSKRSIVFNEVLSNIGKLAAGAIGTLSGGTNAIEKLQAFEDGRDLGSKLKNMISGHATNKIMAKLNGAWRAGSFKEFEKTGHAYHLALDPEFYKLGGFANIKANDDGMLEFTISGFYEKVAEYNTLTRESERQQDTIGYYNKVLENNRNTRTYVYDHDNKEWILI